MPAAPSARRGTVPVLLAAATSTVMAAAVITEPARQRTTNGRTATTRAATPWGLVTLILGMALPDAVGAAVSLGFRRIRDHLSFPALTLTIFLTIGAGLLLPTTSSWIAHATPAALRGRLLGMLSTAVYLGQFLSPLASQPITRAATVSTAFTAGALLCAAVAITITVIVVSSRRRTALERETTT